MYSLLRLDNKMVNIHYPSNGIDVKINNNNGNTDIVVSFATSYEREITIDDIKENIIHGIRSALNAGRNPTISVIKNRRPILKSVSSEMVDDALSSLIDLGKIRLAVSKNKRKEYFVEVNDKYDNATTKQFPKQQH